VHPPLGFAEHVARVRLVGYPRSARAKPAL